MYVIIKNISTNITIEDIERCVSPATRGDCFQKNVHIKALKLIQLVDSAGNPVERHGLIRVDSDRAQKQLISSLNGRVLGGAHADEYIIRHCSNDRREEKFLDAPPPGNQRDRDRRRHCLRVQVVNELTC